MTIFVLNHVNVYLISATLVSAVNVQDIYRQDLCSYLHYEHQNLDKNLPYRCTCETGERIPKLSFPCSAPQCSCQGIPKQQPIPAPACTCPPNQPKCNCPVQHPCSWSAQILKPIRVLPITSVSTAKHKPPINCVCPIPTRPCTCPPNQPNCNCPIQHPCSCSNQGVKPSRVIQITNAPTSEQKRPINCVCPIPTPPCICLPNQPNCNCPIQNPCLCSSQGVKPSRVIQITNAPTSEQKRPINVFARYQHHPVSVRLTNQTVNVNIHARVPPRY